MRLNLQFMHLSDTLFLEDQNMHEGENHMIENESLSVTLTLENDEELECDVLTIFETDSRQYIALLPVNADEDSEDGQIYLYRLIDNGEGEEPGLENIVDDDEFERASEAFNDWMESQDFGDIDLDDIDD
jgi:uncharacterized protein YrzB (UPF0473 family)